MKYEIKRATNDGSILATEMEVGQTYIRVGSTHKYTRHKGGCRCHVNDEWYPDNYFPNSRFTPCDIIPKTPQPRIIPCSEMKNGEVGVIVKSYLDSLFCAGVVIIRRCNKFFRVGVPQNTTDYFDIWSLIYTNATVEILPLGWEIIIKDGE